MERSQFLCEMGNEKMEDKRGREMMERGRKIITLTRWRG